MSASTNPDVTFLTEHLTYRPAALIDDIINSINILAFKATEAVEKGLLNAKPKDIGLPPNPSPEAQEKIKDEIENGVHQLETLLEAKIDKNFDKLEVYALRNIFTIPAEVKDYVRLSHHEGLTFVAQSEDAASLESVQMQRRKLRETWKLHALLVAETAKNDATIAAMKRLLGHAQDSVKEEEGAEPAVDNVFGFLQNKGDIKGDGKQPVTTTASFTISQLPALKALLDNLEPRLEKLANGAGTAMVGEEEKSWRRERADFIEKEARRHLENVRGFELGDMGEVRDGEWQGEGRKIGKQEVEDLEKVVGMVSSEAMDEN